MNKKSIIPAFITRVGHSRYNYGTAVLVVAGFWLLTFDIFELVKILHPEQEGLHKFLAYLFPILTIVALGTVFLFRYECLGIRKIKWIGIYSVAIACMLLNKINFPMRIKDIFSLEFLYLIQFLLSFLPVVITAALLLYGFKKRSDETGHQFSPYIMFFAFFLLLLSQVVLLSDGVRYRTQSDLAEFARSGSPEKALLVANNFADGAWTKKNTVQAAEWYRISSEKGAPDALYYMGLLYSETGKESLASKLYSIAAENGVEYAEYRLNVSHYDASRYQGEALDIDGSVCAEGGASFEASKCKIRALAGDAESQYLYARYLEHLYKDDGSFPLSNITFWYERAAIAGAVNAQPRLAAIYERGEYYRRDFFKAEYWYSSAVDRGYIWYYPHTKVLKFIIKKKGV